LRPSTEFGEVLYTGDSGVVPGEGSVTEDVSIVDAVVVGEESDDSEFDVDVLSRCWWKTE